MARKRIILTVACEPMLGWYWDSGNTHKNVIPRYTICETEDPTWLKSISEEAYKCACDGLAELTRESFFPDSEE